MLHFHTVHSPYALDGQQPAFGRRAWLTAFATFGLAVMAGCASTPRPTTTAVTLTLVAAADANPDGQGRASPVVARFYALKAPGAFESADFFSLQDKDAALLGTDLAQREEVVLRPGEQKEFRLTLAGDVHVLGFMGEYRDLNHAQWRRSQPLVPGQPIVLTVTYGARGIALAQR